MIISEQVSPHRLRARKFSLEQRTPFVAIFVTLKIISSADLHARYPYKQRAQAKTPTTVATRNFSPTQLLCELAKLVASVDWDELGVVLGSSLLDVATALSTVLVTTVPLLVVVIVDPLSVLDTLVPLLVVVVVDPLLVLVATASLLVLDTTASEMVLAVCAPFVVPVTVVPLSVVVVVEPLVVLGVVAP